MMGEKTSGLLSETRKRCFKVASGRRFVSGFCRSLAILVGMYMSKCMYNGIYIYVCGEGGLRSEKIWGATVDDDDPFIVLTETKFSFRCIPVGIGTLLTGLEMKNKHM